MLAREPIPPPLPSQARPAARELHTSLQLPGEARWSRPSAIALSVLVHILLFLVIRQAVWKKPVPVSGPVFQVFTLSQPQERPQVIHAPPLTQPAREQTQTAQIVTTQPRPETPAKQNPQLVQPTEVPTTLPPPGAAIAEPSLTAPAPAAPQSAADRLLHSSPSLPAGFGVPRAGMPPMPTPQEIASARLASGIKAFNDSMAGAATDAAKATDWTKTTKDGKRWGVSPGQIHLGSITLPLPFSFGVSPGRRDDYNKAMGSYAASNAQAKRIEMEETFESRVKAMRKRKDAQRDSAKAAQIGH